MTGGLSYFTPTSNLVRNYLLGAEEHGPIVSRWNQRALLSDKVAYGAWLKETVNDIRPEVLVVLPQSHQEPRKPYFDAQPTPPIDLITQLVHLYLAVPGKTLQVTFPDLPPEEQLARLTEKIEEVSQANTMPVSLHKQ